MFEIMAKNQDESLAFYGKVFGWNFDIGDAGFAYVKFPQGAVPLLGGIGQADASVPGLEPGHSFYLVVASLEAAIEAAVHAGGSRHMAPATADGYRFAMIRDPENNPIGLVEPFGQ
jgi:predicted enzyme related to lactoylglutathione lyase